MTSSRWTTASRRAALTAAEVMVTVGLVAALAIPTFGLFLQGRGLAFKSKYAYLAVVAAREEIEDLRVRAHTMAGEPWTLKHEWRAVTGAVVARLADLDPDRELGALTYAKDQERVWTMLEVLPPSGPATWPAVLHVRWQEHGETPGGPDEQPGLSRFEFVLVKPVVTGP